MCKPFVSIITVNYNGLRFLDTCLSALGRIEYPGDRFEVVLVDNASTDGSAAWVREHFPWVRVIENDKNLGFAGGNNVAIRATQGDYVALINNDTAVEPGWLDALVEVAEHDPQIGACTSKLLFFYDRFPLKIATIPPFEPRKHGFSMDGRRLGVKLSSATLASGGQVEYTKGVYGWEDDGVTRFRWLAPEAWLRVPVVNPQADDRLVLCFRSPPTGERVRVSAWVGDIELGQIDVGQEPVEWCIDLPRSLYRNARPIIQSTGSLVSIDGSGRDRGAVIEEGFHFYEEDRGQYNKREEVFAANGASSLYRRAMLNDVGLFDERFFMYYEDTDLSWRMRLRGWKIVYVPESVVRHVHCGSSGEWSLFFTYHVKKNRLAMVAKNGNWAQIMLSWAGYGYALALTAASWGRSLINDRRPNWAGWRRLWTELRSGFWVLLNWPGLMVSRWHILRRRCVSQPVILSMMSPLMRP